MQIQTKVTPLCRSESKKNADLVKEFEEKFTISNAKLVEIWSQMQKPNLNSNFREFVEVFKNSSVTMIDAIADLLEARMLNELDMLKQFIDELANFFFDKIDPFSDQVKTEKMPCFLKNFQTDIGFYNDVLAKEVEKFQNQSTRFGEVLIVSAKEFENDVYSVGMVLQRCLQSGQTNQCLDKFLMVRVTKNLSTEKQKFKDFPFQKTYNNEMTTRYWTKVVELLRLMNNHLQKVGPDVSELAKVLDEYDNILVEFFQKCN